MSEAIAAMTSPVEDATTRTVQEGLRANREAIGSAAQKVADYDKEIAKTLKEHIIAFKEQQRRLFQIDGIRNGIFWAGCVSNVISLLLLVWVLFFNG